MARSGLARSGFDLASATNRTLHGPRDDASDANTHDSGPRKKEKEEKKRRNDEKALESQVAHAIMGFVVSASPVVVLILFPAVCTTTDGLPIEMKLPASAHWPDVALSSHIALDKLGRVRRRLAQTGAAGPPAVAPMTMSHDLLTAETKTIRRTRPTF